MADAIYAAALLALFPSILISLRSGSFNHETLPGTARLDQNKLFEEVNSSHGPTNCFFRCRDRDRAVVGLTAGRRRADQPRSVTKIASQ
jgi:hypothetical protein